MPKKKHITNHNDFYYLYLYANKKTYAIFILSNIPWIFAYVIILFNNVYCKSGKIIKFDLLVLLLSLLLTINLGHYKFLFIHYLNCFRIIISEYFLRFYWNLFFCREYFKSFMLFSRFSLIKKKVYCNICITCVILINKVFG